MAGLFAGCGKETECTIKGAVTDRETGAPLPGVLLTLQPTGKQVQTAQDGTYILENLKADTYTLRAQKEGYADCIKEIVEVISNRILLLNIKMSEENYLAESDYTLTTFGLNMEMVYVEGGTFEMGATAEQGNDAQDDEYPVRTIKLDGYHIGKYEVTQAQWKAVMGTDPSKSKGDNFPVENVRWYDAQSFCQKLSEATGRKYVLPTEAQWEYAARGGNKSQHYKYAGSNDIDEVAWYYYYNSSDGTHPVGTKKANELGLYDMSGNVWEWCSDWYGNYDANDTDNPQGSANGSYRVIRGGGRSYAARNCRVSNRSYGTPYNCGFRVACMAE